jgi:hypothetical protein
VAENNLYFHLSISSYNTPECKVNCHTSEMNFTAEATTLLICDDLTLVAAPF